MLHELLMLFLPLIIVATSTNQSYIECTDKEEIPHNVYEPHGFTSRGLDDLVFLFKKERLDLFKYLETHPNAYVLDNGCGSGHALLQIQEKFPNMTTYCTNKDGYGMSQSETTQDLVDVAYHYSIKIHCTETRKPIIPNIVLTKGIANGELLNHSFYGKFDFIYSMHALNYGKLAITESHIWLDKLVPLLKASAGSRMVLILNKYDLDQRYATNKETVDSKNRKIKTWQYYENKCYIYVTLYTILLANYSSPYLGATVAKCVNEFCKTNHGFGTVHVVDSDKSDFINKLRRLKTSKYGNGPILNGKTAAETSNGNDNLYAERYTIEYTWNLLYHLDKKEQRFPLPTTRGVV